MIRRLMKRKWNNVILSVLFIIEQLSANAKTELFHTTTIELQYE